MATEYREAPEVERIGTSLIRDFHSRLRDCKIRYLLRFGEWRKGGKECWSATTLLSGATQHVASDVDAIVQINGEAWEALRESQRVALVDHELTHLEVNTTGAGDIIHNPQTGRPMLRSVSHDVEEFASVIERHGLWRPDLEMAAEAIRARELSMFDVSEDEDTNGRLPGDTAVELSTPDGQSVRTNVRELRRVTRDLAGRARGGAIAEG